MNAAAREEGETIRLRTVLDVQEMRLCVPSGAFGRSAKAKEQNIRLNNAGFRTANYNILVLRWCWPRSTEFAIKCGRLSFPWVLDTFRRHSYQLVSRRLRLHYACRAVGGLRNRARLKVSLLPVRLLTVEYGYSSPEAQDTKGLLSQATPAGWTRHCQPHRSFPPLSPALPESNQHAKYCDTSLSNSHATGYIPRL
jgi:hypothetical protein